MEKSSSSLGIPWALPKDWFTVGLAKLVGFPS